MRKIMVAAGGAMMLAACGGGSGGTASGVSVVSGTTPTPSPTPSPTPTATPAPTPTPTPTSSYTRFADLTGDRTFQTACASLVLGSGLPNPQAAAPFGESLALGYTTANGGWSVNGDGVALTFTNSDAVTAPSGQKIYQRTVNGSVQQLTIADSSASGTTLTYTRALALRADRSAGTTLYSCVFGVPSSTADVPTTTFTYSRVGVGGTAYMTTSSGTVQTYLLTGSTGTASYDSAAKKITFRVHLVGYLQTGSTVSTTATDLGTYTGSGAVDASKSRYSGSLDGVDRVNLFASFAGAFFGGVETGAAFDLVASDTASGNRVAAVGTITAVQ